MPFTKDDPNINRDGRPKGVKNFTTKVREALEKIAEGRDFTYEEAFIKSILNKAIIEGDASTQKLIWNYLDGMPTQRLEHDGELTQKVYVIRKGDPRTLPVQSPPEPVEGDSGQS